MEFTRPQLKFIFECIEKELFFHEQGGDKSTLLKTIEDIVENEINKIENDYVECDTPEKDIEIANQILAILRGH